MAANLHSTRLGSAGKSQRRRRIRLDDSDSAEDEANASMSQGGLSMLGELSSIHPPSSTVDEPMRKKSRRKSTAGRESGDGFIVDDEANDRNEDWSPPSERVARSTQKRDRQDRMRDDSPRSDATSAIQTDEEEMAANLDPEDTSVDVKLLQNLQKISTSARKVVRKPRPKLDSERLLSDTGLPALVEEAKKAKFRGKGFEFDDLDKLMFMYEAWGHQMFPKISFEELVEKLEVLGAKREVHNAMNKIRAGLKVGPTSDEYVQHESTSEEERDQAGSVSVAEREPTDWDKLVEEQEQRLAAAVTRAESNSDFSELDDTDFNNNNKDDRKIEDAGQATSVEGENASGVGPEREELMPIAGPSRDPGPPDGVTQHMIDEDTSARSQINKI